MHQKLYITADTMEESQEEIATGEKSSVESSTSEDTSSSSSASTSSRKNSTGEENEASTSPESPSDSKDTQDTSGSFVSSPSIPPTPSPMAPSVHISSDLQIDPISLNSPIPLESENPLVIPIPQNSPSNPVLPNVPNIPISPVTEAPPNLPFVLSNDSMCAEFLDDQGREDNFTDLDIICADGYIQVHRCLLMGASEFLREMLIEKDILETCAISVPDAKVRHVKQALGLIYAGTALVDKNDEPEVLDVMLMLGFPVAQVLFRKAKEGDLLRPNVLKHMSRQDDSEIDLCTEGNHEEMENDSLSDQNSEETAGNEDDKVEMDIDNENVSVIDTKAAQAPFQNTQMPKSEFQCRDQLQSETLNFHRVPNASLESLCGKGRECLLCGFQISVEETQETLFNHVIQCKLKNGNSTQEIKREVGPSTKDDFNGSPYPPDLRAMTKVESLQINDLSFEEACDDLEKQMEQQQLATKQTLGNKRKMTDDSPNSSHRSTDDYSTNAASSTGSKAKKKKTTSPTTERRVLTRNRKPNTQSYPPGVPTDLERGNGTPLPSQSPQKSHNSPIIERDLSKLKSEVVPGEEASQVSDRSKLAESNGRLSVPGKSEDGSQSGTTGGQVQSTNRVFLEVKEICGIKYNIYGFLDPNQGVQSGKTIAIMVKNDNSFRPEPSRPPFNHDKLACSSKEIS